MGEPGVAKMTRRTKQRALYTSLLSIVACALMLFGTTFAWFSANTTSGINTLTAANFDVEISNDTFQSGEHIVTLTRLGGGSAPGCCQFTLAMTGTYVETTTVSYSDGSTLQGDPVEKTLSTTQTCRANFSEGIKVISFTLNLTSATAEITDISSSWGSDSGGDGVMLRSRAAQPSATEITDGMTINFGMDDQEIELPATEEQEAELAAEKAAEQEAAEKADAEQETAEKAAVEQAAEPPQTPDEVQTPAGQSQTEQNNDSEDNSHDADDTDNSGAEGSGNGAGEQPDSAADGGGEPDAGVGVG